MKLFKCAHCGQLLYFSSRHCEGCKRRVAFLPELRVVASVDATEDAEGVWAASVQPDKLYRFCGNAEFDACNWVVDADGEADRCVACRHNRTIPDLSVEENLRRWRLLEWAKHRLFYTLLELRLPIPNRTDDPEHGLAFDFLADPEAGGNVMTGHDNGLITLALREADGAERERLREKMGETYRTLLGHFRHEIGHYYWDVLVADSDRLDAYRELFGDERADYQQALETHYENGAPADWPTRYISAYASCHPWEDFAETWAHYLHILDTVEMASAFGISVHPAIDETNLLHADFNFSPLDLPDAERLVAAWLPLSLAANSLNRSMGHADFYPFVMPPPVVQKLDFVHKLVRDQLAAANDDVAPEAEPHPDTNVAPKPDDELRPVPESEAA